MYPHDSVNNPDHGSDFGLASTPDLGSVPDLGSSLHLQSDLGLTSDLDFGRDLATMESVLASLDDGLAIDLTAPVQELSSTALPVRGGRTGC